MEYEAVERVFKDFGLPRAIRTDNGVPFASASAFFGLSKLAVWWLRLGIGIERIRPGHPQQNGRHERMHLTLTKEVTKPAAELAWSLHGHSGFARIAVMPTIKLRQDNVRTLPYEGPGGKHQCIYWDTSTDNFGLRVYPSGRRTYVFSYRIRRRKRLATICRVGTLTLDEARKKATKMQGKVVDNVDPKEEADKQRELKSVGQLIAAYVENHAKKKKKTRTIIRSVAVGVRTDFFSCLSGSLAG